MDVKGYYTKLCGLQGYSLSLYVSLLAMSVLFAPSTKVHHLPFTIYTQTHSKEESSRTVRVLFNIGCHGTARIEDKTMAKQPSVALF